MTRAIAKHRSYRVWQPEEEEALRLGVQKHGLGAWELIRADEAFPSLTNRTGVQLKDKWRNLVKFKHLTQAETACLASKSQKLAWKSDPQGTSSGYTDEDRSHGQRCLPSVATCCQQEIHATLLAREAHNIQIEANKALAAALAGVDRGVEGAEELMKNSCYVATQASEKAMKAKQHVVLARRRLGMALLAAEKDLSNESLLEPLAHGILETNVDATAHKASSSACSNGSSPPISTGGTPADHAASKCGGASHDTTAEHAEEPGVQSKSEPKIVCSCGTDMVEASMVACESCGALAHEGCLVMQATTEGRNYGSHPHVCKNCKAEKDSQATEATEATDPAHADGCSSLKRKLVDAGEASNPKRSYSDVSGQTAGIGGGLGERIKELQASLANINSAQFDVHSLPNNLGCSGITPCSQLLQISSSAPAVSINSVAHDIHETSHIMEDNNLLDSVFHDIGVLSDTDLGW